MSRKVRGGELKVLTKKHGDEKRRWSRKPVMNEEWRWSERGKTAEKAGRTVSQSKVTKTFALLLFLTLLQSVSISLSSSSYVNGGKRHEANMEWRMGQEIQYISIVCQEIQYISIVCQEKRQKCSPWKTFFELQIITCELLGNSYVSVCTFACNFFPLSIHAGSTWFW